MWYEQLVDQRSQLEDKDALAAKAKEKLQRYAKMQVCVVLPMRHVRTGGAYK